MADIWLSPAPLINGGRGACRFSGHCGNGGQWSSRRHQDRIEGFARVSFYDHRGNRGELKGR